MVHATERLSPHGLRAGFVAEAYMAGTRDEQIMDHARHRDRKTMRGYVRRSQLVTDSPTARSSSSRLSEEAREASSD